jgi:prevent-host-death family protein
LTEFDKIDTLKQSVYLEEFAVGTITAKQLKQKTGEIIKRIKSGERLTLTYRGKPLAIIEPTSDKDKSDLLELKEFQKTWESIESTLDRAKPKFKNWQEATRWIRNRN